MSGHNHGRDHIMRSWQEIVDVHDEPLTEIEQDPRLQELVMRQHKAMSWLTSRHAQEYVRLALIIRKEKESMS